MGIFGWSYPPGCNSVPGDEPDPPCEVCGGLDLTMKAVERPGHMHCICEECPVCGEVGNMKCYDANGHGMVMMDEQIQRLAINRKAWEDEAKAEEAEWEKQAAEDAEFEAQMDAEYHRMSLLEDENPPGE